MCTCVGTPVGMCIHVVSWCVCTHVYMCIDMCQPCMCLCPSMCIPEGMCMHHVVCYMYTPVHVEVVGLLASEQCCQIILSTVLAP